jgi:hypothetical protein
MSLMGYEVEDLRKMKACVSMFINKTYDKDVIVGLLMTLDFLEGIEEEGRI